MLDELPALEHVDAESVAEAVRWLGQLRRSRQAARGRHRSPRPDEGPDRGREDADARGADQRQDGARDGRGGVLTVRRSSHRRHRQARRPRAPSDGAADVPGAGAGRGVRGHHADPPHGHRRRQPLPATLVLVLSPSGVRVLQARQASSASRCPAITARTSRSSASASASCRIRRTWRRRSWRSAPSVVIAGPAGDALGADRGVLQGPAQRERDRARPRRRPHRRRRAGAAGGCAQRLHQAPRPRHAGISRCPRWRWPWAPGGRSRVAARRRRAVPLPGDRGGEGRWPGADDRGGASAARPTPSSPRRGRSPRTATRSTSRARSSGERSPPS